MLARSFRIVGLVVVIGFVILSVVLYVRWNVLQRAVARWGRVGGGITVDYASMSLGSMPGIPTSQDQAEIRAAAIQMNRSAGVRSLHLATQDWGCEELKRLLERWI
ncbi:MAG: hypothetical protein SH850_09630 [Planctomycetaceae bacterium]|nr:hypothetical protein [Planctomycetaceae bacterium]